MINRYEPGARLTLHQDRNERDYHAPIVSVSLGLPAVFLFMALTAILFTALGSAIGAMLQDMQAFQFVVSFLIMPVFLLSGAMFPLTNLPKGLVIATSMNPLTYGVDGLRQSLVGLGHYGTLIDLVVLSVFAVLLVAFGSYRFSKIQL